MKFVLNVCGNVVNRFTLLYQAIASYLISNSNNAIAMTNIFVCNYKFSFYLEIVLHIHEERNFVQLNFIRLKNNPKKAHF